MDVVIFGRVKLARSWCTSLSEVHPASYLLTTSEITKPCKGRHYSLSVSHSTRICHYQLAHNSREDGLKGSDMKKKIQRAENSDGVILSVDLHRLLPEPFLASPLVDKGGWKEADLDVNSR